MKEKIIKDDFTEQAMMGMIINLCDPKYTLEECLNNCMAVNTKIMYAGYKLGNGEKLNEKASKQIQINYLKEQIPEKFTDYLRICEDNVITILKKAASNNGISDFNMEMCTNGFMFGFKQKDEAVFVVPKEIMDIFNKLYTPELDRERKIALVANTLKYYLVINGFIPIEEFKDIIYNFYNIDIEEEEFNKAINEANCEIIEDSYYSILPKIAYDKMSGDLNKLKREYPYKRFSTAELIGYSDFLTKVFLKISKILGDKKTANLIANEIVTLFCLGSQDANQVCSDIKDMYKLSKKIVDKLEETLEPYESQFKLWCLNGMTYDECIRKEIFEDFVIKEKPKDDTLLSWLNALPKKAQDQIKEYYSISNVSIKTLSEVIINILENEIYEYDNFDIEDILKINEDEDCDMVANEEVLSGYVFLYDENGTVKPIVPKEITEILEANYEEDYDDDYDDDDYDEEDDEEISNEKIMEAIFLKYLYLNGIIEDETVIKLLQDNHGIQTTKDELDSIAKNNELTIIDDKYYSFLDDANQEDIDFLMPLKKQFGKYKEVLIIDSSEDYEKNFQADLEEIYEKKYGEIDDNFDELYFGILFLIKCGICNKQGIQGVLGELDFKIPKDLKAEMEALIKQYKNDISTWVYNGYSLNEYNELNTRQNKKIGRNEPCPCGSGKKYKKCCGK